MPDFRPVTAGPVDGVLHNATILFIQAIDHSDITSDPEVCSTRQYFGICYVLRTGIGRYLDIREYLLHMITQLSRWSMSTSGGYERYMRIEGKKYSHMINPKTGWPVDSLLAITVAAPKAVVASFLAIDQSGACLLYTSPSPRDGLLSRMPSSA